MITKDDYPSPSLFMTCTPSPSGSNNASAISEFVDDLMNPSTGLTNRDTFGYVEKVRRAFVLRTHACTSSLFTPAPCLYNCLQVSWFSEFAFDAFNMSGVTPKLNEAWVSSLFNPYGSLSSVGATFFKHCN